MFALIALFAVAFFVLGVTLILAISRARDAAHNRRIIERQFNSARWWHDNREGLRRMGVTDFKQEWLNEPYERGKDMNPPPRPDRRNNPWNLPDLPEPPQRFA